MIDLDDKTPGELSIAEPSSLSRPKPITKAYCFHLPKDLAICASCPQCGRLIPRDYDERCGACGQALSWDDFAPDKLELVELL